MEEQDSARSHRESPGRQPAHQLVIYGGGGHGKELIELVRALDLYQLAGIVDDGLEAGSQVLGIPVLGDHRSLEDLWNRGIRMVINAVGGIGDLATRMQVCKRITDAGFQSPTLVHPSAVVEQSARLADGVQVLAHAYVGSDASIGYGVIINSAAIVSHDCVIGDYAGISPGALLAGEVEVGEGVQIGMGATLNIGVRIGAGALIGNSAVVKRDVPANMNIHAGQIWPEPKG